MVQGGLELDRFRREAQGKAIVNGEFFPVEVGGDVAGIGDSQRAVRVGAKDKASGEATSAAGEHALVHG